MNETTTAAPTTVRVKGFGTIRKRGGVFWIRYSYLGKRHEESAGTDDQRKAEKLLRQRIMETGKGRRLDPTSESRVKMADLFDALVRDYEVNERRSLATLGFRLKPLREAFGSARALDVTASKIAAYVSGRLAAGKARATINREIAALRRAFSLAVAQDRLASAPKLTTMTENNARQGFVGAADFEAICDKLPAELQDVARFAYVTGWRLREVLTLSWADVDHQGRRITLQAARSKNGQARTIPFVGELAEIIQRRWAARTVGARLVAHVFHRGGRPIKDLRGAWTKATEAAGHAGLLFHDLRRSAVRNLDRAGVTQSVAMKITGHRTTAVYQRYRITTDDDVRAAFEKTEAATRLDRVRVVSLSLG